MINQTVILRGYVSKEVITYGKFIGKDGKESKVGMLSLGVQNGTDKADFLPITFFGHTCDLIAEFTKIGTQLLLSCKLKNNVYKKNNEYKGGVQIICDEFQILSQPKNEKNEEKSNKKRKTA